MAIVDEGWLLLPGVCFRCRGGDQFQPLGMNVRTLQRDRVIRYLQNPGYSMPSSFTRWFSAQGCSDKLLKSGLRLSTPEKEVCLIPLYFLQYHRGLTERFNWRDEVG